MSELPTGLALRRALFGEPPLRRSVSGPCSLTLAGREAVAVSRLHRGEIVTLADVATACGIHPRAVMAEVRAGTLEAETTGTLRLHFSLGAAAAYVLDRRGAAS